MGAGHADVARYNGPSQREWHVAQFTAGRLPRPVSRYAAPVLAVQPHSIHRLVGAATISSPLVLLRHQLASSVVGRHQCEATLQPTRDASGVQSIDVIHRARNALLEQHPPAIKSGVVRCSIVQRPRDQNCPPEAAHQPRATSSRRVVAMVPRLSTNAIVLPSVSSIGPESRRGQVVLGEA